MWTSGLAEWFVDNGRHTLPWRMTTDPWAVLVSEVMLQQTAVNRVLRRWQRFLARWPTAAACAAASLDDVLREWQGLGYPRRARALWLASATVVEKGWPRDEAGLRTLPGIGSYTARALLAFSDLGVDAGAPPRDVNLARVGARAGLGCEPHQALPARLDAVLREARPAAMSMRTYSYALFDVGAIHCRARPDCRPCPLRGSCAWRRRGVAPLAAPRRGDGYQGSLRQLRGALLEQVLRRPGASEAEIASAISTVPGATAERIEAAWQGLAADGLIAGGSRPRR